MKPIRATLLLAELALAVLLVLFAFGHTDSPSLARAWSEYRAHPSPETETAFKKEKSATDRMIFFLTAGVGLLLAVNSYAMFNVFRKGSAGSPLEPQPKPV